MISRTADSQATDSRPDTPSTNGRAANGRVANGGAAADSSQPADPAAPVPFPLTARAPGKVILFGEHAVNRGQPALAAAVGLYARCRVRPADVSGVFRFASGERTQAVGRAALLELAGYVAEWRKKENYDAIRQLAQDDFFAPAKYALASAFGDALPAGLTVEWESDLPTSLGLGSGAAAVVSLLTAITPLLPGASAAQMAEWAHRGDIIAHGGVASGLDSQTSVLGGVIRYSGQALARRVSCCPGMRVVIGNTGVVAATGDVNAGVRSWLAERPKSRIRYFQAIGDLCRAAMPLLESGNWEELGHLFTLNHVILEKVGASSAEIEALIDAALGAGAYGAKLSGSGGGGIIIALVAQETRDAVIEAINAAGGTALTPKVAVQGAENCNFEF